MARAVKVELCVFTRGSGLELLLPHLVWPAGVAVEPLHSSLAPVSSILSHLISGPS